MGAHFLDDGGHVSANEREQFSTSVGLRLEFSEENDYLNLIFNECAQIWHCQKNNVVTALNGRATHG